MIQFPCRTAEQVLMLLKASDITRDELDLLQEIGHSPVLNLTRYHKLNDGMEFRGFVYDQALVGLCQRTHGATHVRDLALGKTKAFFADILTSFPQRNCMRYLDTFDIYIDIAPRHKVWLMDFAPWGLSNFLEFKPEQLEGSAECLWSEQTNFSSAFSSHRVPDEVVDGDLGALIESLKLK